MQVQQEEAIVVRVLVSRGTEMNKTVPGPCGASEWGRQACEQAIEREIGKNVFCCEMGGSHPQIFGTQQTLGN